ncbi:MAG: hypothetical protein ABUL60_24240 [Myxococcales bacterium]
MEPTLMIQCFAHARDALRAALVTVLALSGMGSVGCHQFTACYDQICDEVARGGAPSDEPSTMTAGTGGRATDPAEAGQAGNGGVAAEGGQGGEAGAGGEPDAIATCRAPFADCDESTLTSCETNLDSDLHHCGACNVRCSGFCSAGRCHDLEILAPSVNGLDRAGITVTDTAVYALVDPDDLLLRHLIRFDKVEDATDTLLLLNQRPERVLAGVSNLYLFHDDTSSVWRVDDANVLKEDPLKATSMTLIGSRLYAVGAKGLVAREEGSPTVDSVSLPMAVKPASSSLDLASNGHSLVLLASDSEASPSQYAIYRLDTDATATAWQPVASGTGTPTRLRVTVNAAYVLIDVDADAPDADVLPQELREHGFDGKSQVLLRTADIHDFAIDASAHLYLASHGEPAGLRTMSLANPKVVVDLPMPLGVDTLELDERYLYVASRYDFGLARLPVVDF